MQVTKKFEHIYWLAYHATREILVFELKKNIDKQEIRLFYLCNLTY